MRKKYKPVRPIPPLPCESCGGDHETGHQRLCDLRYEPDNEPDWYYFGCVDRAGHELMNKNLNYGRSYISKRDIPFSLRILDTGLLPENGAQIEGKGSITHINDWTIVSFWDRSVDSRQGSNSAFIVNTKMDLEEFIRKAKEVFPSLWKRFDFELNIG